MKKGILVGNGLDFYKDFSWLIDKGFSVFLIPGDRTEEMERKASFAKENGAEILIVDITSNPNWKQIIDTIDAEYYYIDEPYAVKRNSEEELKEILSYTKKVRPNSKFVIGDMRVIQEKKYKPIEGLYYVYTSYVNNWLIPILDKALPFGGPNQSPSIKRIHKKTNGKVPWIWAYGQNKLLCHPDEYHKLTKTAEKLNIPILMLYLGDGVPGSTYEFNAVSETEMINNILHFINGEKPYTILQWWKRFYNRLKLSINRLLQTWDFKEFIEKLF